MQFANTEYFNYAWGLIPGMILLWFYIQWRKKKIAAIANPSLLSVLLPGHRSRVPVTSGILILLAIGFIILALANPVGTSKPVKGKTNGLDIVFALDVSKSMDATDIKPSRLERATHLINELTEKLAGNKMGLVVFAGNAYVQMPLTTDASAMKLFLANTNTNMVQEQGTAIEGAIETSEGLLFPDGLMQPGQNSASKIIILLTDGEDHEGDAEKAAKEAGKDGIIIMAIGTGTTDGAPMPIYENGLLQGYLKDNNGETVVTKMDPEQLKNIVAQAHGTFYEMSDNVEDELMRKLNSFAKGEQEFELFDLKETHFQWFAGAALFLLLIETAFKNGLIESKNKDEV